MRRRLAVAPLFKSVSVAAAFLACPVLAQAASVQTVFAAENALYGAGYSVGPVDGWIDEKLRAALRQYQSDRPGLSVNGELDSQTLAALGISGSHSELMGDNVVASREAARKELGLMMASASAPAPAPAPKAEPKPRQIAATPKPVVKLKPRSEPKPEPVQQAKPEPVSKPEPTSEPIKITANVRASKRDEFSAVPAVADEAPEKTVNVASVSNPERTQAALPKKAKTPEADQKTISAEAVNEAPPTEPKGNVITKVFYFLFGWIG